MEDMAPVACAYPKEEKPDKVNSNDRSSFGPMINAWYTIVKYSKSWPSLRSKTTPPQPTVGDSKIAASICGAECLLATVDPDLTKDNVRLLLRIEGAHYWWYPYLAKKGDIMYEQKLFLIKEPRDFQDVLRHVRKQVDMKVELVFQLDEPPCPRRRRVSRQSGEILDGHRYHHLSEDLSRIHVNTA